MLQCQKVCWVSCSSAAAKLTMLSNARNQTNNHNYTANWCYIRNISQTKSCVTIICETLVLHCHSLVERWLISLVFSTLSAFALHCWTICASGGKLLRACQSCAPLGQLLHLFLPPSFPLQLQWPWGHQQRCVYAPMHPLQHTHPSVTMSIGFSNMFPTTQHTTYMYGCLTVAYAACEQVGIDSVTTWGTEDSGEKRSQTAAWRQKLYDKLVV